MRWSLNIRSWVNTSGSINNNQQSRKWNTRRCPFTDGPLYPKNTFNHSARNKKLNCSRRAYWFVHLLRYTESRGSDTSVGVLFVGQLRSICTYVTQLFHNFERSISLTWFRLLVERFGEVAANACFSTVGTGVNQISGEL